MKSSEGKVIIFVIREKRTEIAQFGMSGKHVVGAPTYLECNEITFQISLQPYSERIFVRLSNWKIYENVPRRSHLWELWQWNSHWQVERLNPLKMTSTWSDNKIERDGFLSENLSSFYQVDCICFLFNNTEVYVFLWKSTQSRLLCTLRRR